MKNDRQKLESATAALKTGNKTAARQLFSDVLRQNPDSDDAWVGLALCADDPQRRKELLQRALRLNPAHAYARSALARLDEVPAPLPAKDPKTQRRWMEVYLGLALLGLLVCGLLAGLGFILNQQTQTARVESLPVEFTTESYVFIDFYADW